MNNTTTNTPPDLMAPLSSAYMRIELIEWLRASGITLIDLVSCFAIARKGSREKATDFLEDMGFVSLVWEKSFHVWLMEHPIPQHHLPRMEAEYQSILYQIQRAHR